MKRFVSCACVVVLASAILAAQQKPNWVDPAKFTQPPTDQLADLQRRLFRPPLQPADEDQRRQRQTLSLGWIYRTAPGLGGGVPIKGTPRA